MNKRQRKKKVYSIIFKYYKRHEAIELRRHIRKGVSDAVSNAFIEYSNSDEFKKQEHNIMFGSPQRKPHGWCMIEGHEWSEYIQETKELKIHNQV